MHLFNNETKPAILAWRLHLQPERWKVGENPIFTIFFITWHSNIPNILKIQLWVDGGILVVHSEFSQDIWGFLFSLLPWTSSVCALGLGSKKVGIGLHSCMLNYSLFQRWRIYPAIFIQLYGLYDKYSVRVDYHFKCLLMYSRMAVKP